MDAVLGFLRREEPRNPSERRKIAAHHEHRVPDAEVARDDLHDLRLAAMAVHQDEFAQPGTVDAFTDLGPQPDQGLGAQRQSPGKGLVLVRLADLHRRQHEDAVGHQRHRRAHDALIDDRVDAERQMRPVLLDRGDRQNSDDTLDIERGREIRGDEVAPESSHGLVRGKGTGQRRSRIPRADRKARAAIGWRGSVGSGDMLGSSHDAGRWPGSCWSTENLRNSADKGGRVVVSDSFIAAIGDSPIITDRALVRQKSRDFFWYSPLLKQALNQKSADLIVCPRTEADVIQAAALCARHKVPLTARGAGTGNYGQAVPLHGGIVLDMAGMERIVALEDGLLTIEAGRKLIDIERQAAPQAWELRMYPSTKRSATIGGFVAGGSGGIRSVPLSGPPQPRAHARA